MPDYTTTYLSPQSDPMIGWKETKPSYEEAYGLNQAMDRPSEYGRGYTFPALFKLADKGWALISETGVHGQYVGARLGDISSNGVYPLEFPMEEENNGIGDNYPSMPLPAQTPWRTITLGENLKPIVESTIAYDLVDELYVPNSDYLTGRSTWSWIVWDDNSINYEDQIKYIDLAAALEFEYVLIDNWWDEKIGKEKIEELVDYAKNKGVAILLWYNSNGYWNNAPQTPRNKMNISFERKKEMKWMHDIGVKGIKVDFFGGDKQTTMKLYEDIMVDANEYGLGVVFHGSTLPRGWERMFPNYMSSESVLASENLKFTQESQDKHALNATILPFTRNAVGAMDFGPVFLNDIISRDQKEGTKRKTTETFELATSILYFSPIQPMGITPNNLEEQPDFVIDFLKEVPTTWDDTKYITGTPENEVVLARKKDGKWFIAAVNGENHNKTLEIDLPMIKGRKATLITDTSNGKALKKEIKIGKNGKVKLALKGQGGAIVIAE